jgi:hypothetical protein
MGDLRAAAQQAREVLRHAVDELSRCGQVAAILPCTDAIEALRAALEQEEQEPVAIKDDDGLTLKAGWDDLPVGTPLYTHPPRREWQGLTEQRDELLEALRTAADHLEGMPDPEDVAACVAKARAAIAKAEGK